MGLTFKNHQLTEILFWTKRDEKGNKKEDEDKDGKEDGGEVVRN